MGLPLFAFGVSVPASRTRKDPPAVSWRVTRGPFLVCPEALVKIVGTDALEVERALLAGELACPCGGRLGPWGHARVRVVRRRGGEEHRRPRRSRCVACEATHVLLGEDTLLRRRDSVEVIGAALAAKAGGQGQRRSARALGVHVSTVRGWLRRFARASEAVRAFFSALAHRLDPLLAPLARPPRCSPMPWRRSRWPPGPPRCASVLACRGTSPRRRPADGCSPTPVPSIRAPPERGSVLPFCCLARGGPMHDRHRDVALFRYSLIRDAADVSLTSAERGALVRALA